MISAEGDLMSRRKTNVMVVEDHQVFRMGLRELINQEDDLVVCGETDNADSALIEIPKARPDLVIVDISLRGRDGIGLVRDISRLYKEIPVLVLSMHDESRFAERSLLAGARGYIMKRETSERIIEAIRCVMSGKTYLSEKIKEEILGRFVGGNLIYDRSPVDSLSDRELEVFRLLGYGMSTNEVAEKLHLSAKTVGTYRMRIKEKLNLRHSGELIRQAMLWVENEQLDPPPAE
jgi:DNA-binding NarL/FixJ family response regulator